MRNVLTAALSALLMCFCLYGLVAAQSITRISPRTCPPGKTTSLTVHGKELHQPLRAVSATSEVAASVQRIEASEASLNITVAEDASLGPCRVWLATPQGTISPQLLWIDDLPAVLDQGSNHSWQTAQAVPTECSIEGTCDAAFSDFYRFSARAGQRLAVQVFCQPLHSPMDPVIRLANAAGDILLTADDTLVGPDCSMRYEFEADGEYWLEVFDSRHAAGGADYQLRIGDFPLVEQCFPLAVGCGQTTEIHFVGPDAAQLPPVQVTAPAAADQIISVPARFEDAAPASWSKLLSSAYPQYVEPSEAQVLPVPLGISGRLQAPGQIDGYRLRGTKGQTVRVVSRTRSLGSPTLLHMALLDAAGARLGETQVGDSDEWSLELTFPDDGEYRLQVHDLLERGGEAFTYWIEVVPAGRFAVALKADAKTRQEHTLEAEQGACAVDLQIARFGYAGAIDLVLDPPAAGLSLLNPRIAAGADQARVFIAATAEWSPEALAAFRLRGNAVDDPQHSVVVSHQALLQVQKPWVLSHALAADGMLAVAGRPVAAQPFELQLEGSLQCARPLRKHTATLTLKRLQEDFKGNVELVPGSLPPGWQASWTADKDRYQLALEVEAERAADEPDELSLHVYGEWQGRGRLVRLPLPVSWFDPLDIRLSFDEPLFRGGRARARLQVQRVGGDPQPVSVSWTHLPDGVRGPQEVVIAADQQQVEVEFEIAADASAAAESEIVWQARSQYAQQEFHIEGRCGLPQLMTSPHQLTVYPAEVRLQDVRSRQQLVVTGIDADNVPRDWTRTAVVTVRDPQVVQVQHGVVFPRAAGQTQIDIQVGDQQVQVPVQVAALDEPHPPEFESEVLVALSKQGCNSGACHGAPSGKGGFRLSLRAFDAQLDQLTLIREDGGRRVNPLDADQSLLLLKPLMKVTHGGGKQLRPSDAAYDILRQWIAAGAPQDPVDAPRIVRLEVVPREKQVLALANGGQQLAVTAHFADGRTRDVTHLAAYESSNSEIATVDAQGWVTPHRRGEVAILVRLLEYIEAVPLMFVEDQPGFQWQAPPPVNYVDELVYAKLQQLQYVPAETCSDEEFIRRVYLDVVGILPSISETKAFLHDAAVDKRQRLIDALLEREEHAKFWALKWGDLLRLTSKTVGDEGVFKYYRWLETAIQENMPYDEFARQLLTGSGSTLANPPANFYRTATDMNECVETVSQIFLGARLQCAKCHNHPFERWTQDNYYGLGAFFSQLQRRKTGRPGEAFVYASGAGDVVQPRTGKTALPWLPQVGTLETAAAGDRRETFAQWLVDRDNPYFARIEVNRMWSQLFARGIVDPIDDFRDSNPPSNAPLLDALAEDFVASGFDRKHLLRVILNSRTYQASYQTNEFNQDDTLYFSHQQPRLLSAEQLLDAINHTLGLQQAYGALPAGTHATHLPAPDVARVEFLKVFGQPERSTVCACERVEDSNLGMAIELFNGSMLHAKLQDEANRFRVALKSGQSPEQVIGEIYLASLCRPPTDIELQAALQHCAACEDLARGVEDVCWALVNTDEFLFQH